MFPPYVLVLFLFVLPLLCFLLGKLPLSFLALEKRLYLREQDTGQGFHLVIGYPGAVVIGLSLIHICLSPTKSAYRFIPATPFLSIMAVNCSSVKFLGWKNTARALE